MKEAGIFWAKLTRAKVIPRLSGERKGRRFGLESRSWAIYQQASSSARLVSEWPHLGSPEGQNTELEGNEEQHRQQNEAQGLWNPARMMSNTKDCSVPASRPLTSSISLTRPSIPASIHSTTQKTAQASERVKRVQQITRAVETTQ